MHDIIIKINHWFIGLLFALAVCFSVSDAQAAKKLNYFTSNFRDATVFRDKNQNGQLDAEETAFSQKTDGEGRFKSPKGKGRLSLFGGTEISTGQPNNLLLTAPSGARGIGILTALWQALLERTRNLTKVRKLLFVPTKTTVDQFAAVSIDKTKPKSQREKLVKRNAQHDTLARFLKALTHGGSGKRAGLQTALAPTGEDPTINALAQALIGLKATKPVDITKPETVKALLNGALNQSNTAVSAENLQLVSVVAATSLNAEIDKVSAKQPQRLQTLENDRAKGSGYLASGDFAGFKEYFFPAPKFTAMLEDTGRSATDRVTQDNTPTLTGVAPPQSVKLRVYRNGLQIGEITPDVNGNWNYTSPALPDGLYAFGLTGVTSFGFEGMISATMPVTIDTTPPGTPTVKPVFQTGSVRPTLTGDWGGDTGNELRITVNGHTYTNAKDIITTATNWSLRLPQGAGLVYETPYEVMAIVEDRAGNTATDRSTQELSISLFRSINPVPTEAGFQPRLINQGDFNRDGTLDLVVTSMIGVYMLLGNGDGTFTSSQVASNGIAVGDVGDVNRDGKLDLAVIGPSGVFAMLGDGQGSFQSQGEVLSGGYSSPMKVGNFNGDSNPDLVVANSGGVSVLSGNGVGGFQVLGSYSTGSKPGSIETGDVNGDGLLDLAVATDNGVSVLQGNGAGGFQAIGDFLTGGNLQAIALGDVDGDGKLDLAAKHGNTVSVLLGHGNGTFQTNADYPSGGGSSRSISIGDLNGDGLVDLAVANHDDYSVSVLLGAGAGRFQPKVDYPNGESNDEPASVAMGDWNGDGRLDLAVANEGGGKGGGGGRTISVLLNQSDGSFVAKNEYVAGALPQSVAMGDVNGDGVFDLVVANQGGSELDCDLGHAVSVLLGRGDGSFQPKRDYIAGAGPKSIAMHDFNRDGSLDLAVANIGCVRGGASVSVLLGHGDGRFQDAVDYPAGPLSSFLAIGDANSDGWSDLVTVGYTSLSVFLGDGHGNFQRKTDDPNTNSFRESEGKVAVGDANGDGRLDIAVASYGGSVSVLLGNGDGSFQAKRDGVANGYPVAVDDVNGDGRFDLAVVSASGVTMLMGSGTASYRAKRDYYGGGIPAVGDVNGDGWLDLAVAANEYNSDAVSLMLGKDDASFQGKRVFPVGSGQESVAMGDLNGDGLPDLALVTYRGVTVLLNNWP